MSSIEIRKKMYFQLSSQIAQLDNNQLRSLLDANQLDEPKTVWGNHYTISLKQTKVFVKCIPITTLESDNLFCTQNLYSLPTFYNYGLGSTGVNVFRELITHLKTTCWVLEDKIVAFPLMYHYRMIPCCEQRESIEIQQWGNQPAIERYVRDRTDAKYELVLFLEHIPHVLDDWLQKNPNHFQQSFTQLCQAIAFLRTQGIVHFDAHFRNVLTDGEQIYLTDFGLVMDKSFGLTTAEEVFLEQNTFYDYGEIIRNLGYLIRLFYDTCSELDKRKIAKKYGISPNLLPYQISLKLLDNIEQMQTDKDMDLDPFYVASIVKYRGIITLMQNFFLEMRANDQKDTNFPHEKLEQLLQETGFLLDK